MFVKNLVLLCNPITIGSIVIDKDDGSTEQVYTGKINEIPFYFYNERVNELRVVMNNLFIHIKEKVNE